MLKNRVGVSQIISGLDDPYPLGEMESVGDCYPGKVMDDAENLGIITSEEKAAIWSKENAAIWSKEKAAFWSKQKAPIFDANKMLLFEANKMLLF